MFFLAILFAVVFLGALVALALAGSEETRGGALGIGGICLVGAVVCGVVASMSVVPTRNVGIVTTWGKPTGRTTGAGLQWTAPWSDVDDWDASGQTWAHLDDRCVWVTVKGPRNVCVPVQVEWSALPENAPANWAAFKEADGKSRFETWVSRRVDPQMTATLITTFANFDPFAAVDPVTGDIAVPNLNATYRKPLDDALTVALGHDIAVKSIAFGRPIYDKDTTDALAEYGKKALAGRNLDLDKKNAAKRKLITDIDAQVNSVARCLSIAEANDKEPGLCMAGGVTLTHATN